GGELKRADCERVDIKVGDSGASIELLEIGLKNEVSRILRPQEGIVAEWLIRPRESQTGAGEKKRIAPGCRIVRADDRSVGSCVAIDVGEPLAALDPIDVSRPLSAREDRTCLRRLVHRREPLFLLGARRKREADDDRDKTKREIFLHCRLGWEGSQEARKALHALRLLRGSAGSALCSSHLLQ